MRARVLILSGFIWGALFAGVLMADNLDGPCREERTGWFEALEFLREAVQEYQKVNEEPLGPAIEEELTSKGGRVPIARIVQGVLQERSRRMTEARKRTEALLRDEKSALERCRRCVSQGRAGRHLFSKSDPEFLARERLIAQAQDQLLDEAYAQYKDSKLPLPYASSDGPGYSSQAWYLERGAAGPSRGQDSRPGYNPFGYANPRQPYPNQPGWR